VAKGVGGESLGQKIWRKYRTRVVPPWRSNKGPEKKKSKTKIRNVQLKQKNTGKTPEPVAGKPKSRGRGPKKSERENRFYGFGVFKKRGKKCELRLTPTVGNTKGNGGVPNKNGEEKRNRTTSP